jgi:tight adherence protein C
VDAANRSTGNGMIAVLSMAATIAATIAAMAPLRVRRPRRLRQALAAPPATPLRRVRQSSALLRQRRQHDDTELPEAVDLLVLAIRQGLLPAAAIREIAPFTTGAVRTAMDATVARLDGGDRFADAITSLPDVLGPQAHLLADGFAAADRDGLPLAPVLERLAADARQMRRRRFDERARRLPVRLAVPLVLCTLPSFALLTVVPLLLAALTSLHR